MDVLATMSESVDLLNDRDDRDAGGVSVRVGRPNA